MTRSIQLTKAILKWDCPTVSYIQMLLTEEVCILALGSNVLLTPNGFKLKKKNVKINSELSIT